MKHIRRVQVLLNLISPILPPLTADGIWGPVSANRAEVLLGSRTPDTETRKRLEIIAASAKPFFVVLDAGHGGLDASGTYTTAGKAYRHPGEVLHGDGWFLEGVENRIIADMLTSRLRERGILTIHAHHSFRDAAPGFTASQELTRRAQVAAPYLEAGLHGFYLSIHSNAVSTSVKNQDGTKRRRTAEELDAIRGLIVYTTPGITRSDSVAVELLRQWVERFGSHRVRKADRAKTPGMGSDHEANFAVLRESERLASLYSVQYYTAILEEFDFFTSRPAALWITSEVVRKMRVECLLQTVLFAMKEAKVEMI
jgi:N-acetylmuramoyl-L-alanine amidase